MALARTGVTPSMKLADGEPPVSASSALIGDSRCSASRSPLTLAPVTDLPPLRGADSGGFCAEDDKLMARDV